MKIIHKYHRFSAYAALLSYLFLVSLTIFHYHHVDMQEGNYAFANYSDTGESPFDKIIDLTHECMIQQFAGTVINLTHLDGLNLLRLNNTEKFSFDEQLIHSFAPHYNSNPHRGPPSIV